MTRIEEITAAEAFRKEHGFPKTGLIVFFNEQPAGWTPDSEQVIDGWKPGCVGIGYGERRVACGGNAQDGAVVWRLDTAHYTYPPSKRIWRRAYDFRGLPPSIRRLRMAPFVRRVRYQDSEAGDYRDGSFHALSRGAEQKYRRLSDHHLSNAWKGLKR